MPRHPPTTRLFILADPRTDHTERYVGYGSTAEPWIAPRCEVGSSLALWLAELRSLNMEPLVRFDGLITTAVPVSVARWIARVVTKELVAANMTVLTARVRRVARPNR